MGIRPACFRRNQSGCIQTGRLSWIGNSRPGLDSLPPPLHRKLRINLLGFNRFVLIKVRRLNWLAPAHRPDGTIDLTATRNPVAACRYKAGVFSDIMR